MTDDRIEPIRIGVVGFSRNQFDQDDARAKFRDCLTRAIEHLVKKGAEEGLSENDVLDRIEIVSGYTNMGVPKIAYEVADELKLTTVGFSAAQALRVRSGVYPCTKKIIVGKKFGDESDAFLNYIDLLIRIGGGPQARNETEMFKQRYGDRELSQNLYELEVAWLGK